MISTLPNGTEFGIHLRAPSASGGKDWIGTVAGTIITTFWGKTVQTNQMASRPGSRNHLNLMIKEKVAKGYVEVDRYDDKSGWESQRKEQKTKGDKPFAAKPIYREDITKNISIDAQQWDF